MRARMGRCLPFSHPLMVPKVTSISRAKASCVRPRAARIFLISEGTSAAETSSSLLELGPLPGMLCDVIYNVTTPAVKIPPGKDHWPPVSDRALYRRRENLPRAGIQAETGGPLFRLRRGL